MPSLRSTRRSGKMAATDAAKELKLHGNTAAKRRAADRERLKTRAVRYLRRADGRGGRVFTDVAVHLQVTERMATRLLAELIEAGRVERTPETERFRAVVQAPTPSKPKKLPQPLLVLGHELTGRQKSLVLRLRDAGTWVRPHNVSGRGHDGVRSMAEALKELGIVQLDTAGRMALTREAYRELTASSPRRGGAAPEP